MGLVFWTLVGLLLVLPKVFQDADERPENS
jgi:hypothetical protein